MFGMAQEPRSMLPEIAVLTRPEIKDLLLGMVSVTESHEGEDAKELVGLYFCAGWNTSCFNLRDTGGSSGPLHATTPLYNTDYR